MALTFLKQMYINCHFNIPHAFRDAAVTIEITYYFVNTEFEYQVFEQKYFLKRLFFIVRDLNYFKQEVC